MPVYLEGAIPASMAWPEDTQGVPSLWQAFARLQQIASSDYAANTPLVRRLWQEFEQPWAARRMQVEERASELLNSQKHDEVFRCLSEWMQLLVDETLKQIGRIEQNLTK